MSIETLDTLIPIAGVVIFLGILVFVRITNPENKKIRTRTSFKAIAKKEICPRCGVKMNKKWVKRSLGLSSMEHDSIYEEEMQPEFVCPKCNYKIEAVFNLK